MPARTAMRLREQAIPLDVVTEKFCAHRAIADDQHAIADRGDFLEIARSNDDRGASLRRVAQQINCRSLRAPMSTPAVGSIRIRTFGI